MTGQNLGEKIQKFRQSFSAFFTKLQKSKKRIVIEPTLSICLRKCNNLRNNSILFNFTTRHKLKSCIFMQRTIWQRTTRNRDTKNQIFYECGPPILGSHLFDHHLWSVFLYLIYHSFILSRMNIPTHHLLLHIFWPCITNPWKKHQNSTYYLSGWVLKKNLALCTLLVKLIFQLHKSFKIWHWNNSSFSFLTCNTK